MFKCKKCNKVTKPGEKQHKETVKTRTKQYYYEQFVDDRGRTKRVEDAKGNPVYKVVAGSEIVEEIDVCGSC